MPTEAASAVSPDPKGKSGRARRLAPSEKVWSCVLLGQVLFALLAFGGSDISVAVFLAAVYALALVGLLGSSHWARRDLVRIRGWMAPGLLFAVLLAVTLWPLTPWGPGGRHPVWSYLPGSSGSLTVDRSALVLSVVQFLGLACLFVMARIIGASDTRARWILRTAVFMAGAYAVMAVLDHVSTRRTTRLAATLLSPNTAATLFGASFLLAMAFLTHRLRRGAGRALLNRGDPLMMLGAGAGAVLLIALMMTASRAGLMAVSIGAALFLVWEGFGRGQRFRAGVVLGGVAMLLALSLLALRSTDVVAERFGLAARDAAIRAQIFTPHWEAFLTSPWSGFGLGSFATVNHLIATRETLPMLFDVRAVHNLYLQWLEEGGIVGATVMLALFVALLWPTLRGGFRDGAMGIWCRAICCAAVLFLIHGITDFALQVPAIQAAATVVLGVVGGAVAGKVGDRVWPLPTWPSGLAMTAGGAVAAVAILTATPLIAGKFDADLSSWPTAPADALGRAVEIGLAQQPHPSAEELRRLQRLSEREVAMRPASGAAWLRRAVVEAALGDDAQVNRALMRSFAVAPLQTSLFRQRTIFAYEHWDRLDGPTREQVIYQFDTEWRRRRTPKAFVAMANGLQNPAGRVGMALEIAVLRLEPPAPAN